MPVFTDILREHPLTAILATSSPVFAIRRPMSESPYHSNNPDFPGWGGTPLSMIPCDGLLADAETHRDMARALRSPVGVAALGEEEAGRLAEQNEKEAREAECEWCSRCPLASETSSMCAGCDGTSRPPPSV